MEVMTQPTLEVFLEKRTEYPSMCIASFYLSLLVKKFIKKTEN